MLEIEWILSFLLLGSIVGFFAGLLSMSVVGDRFADIYAETLG